MQQQLLRPGSARAHARHRAHAYSRAVPCIQRYDTHLCAALQTQLGDFDQATMLRQIELWGERIIPAIRKEIGQASLAVA